jgi:FkbM family methyltransferase
MIETLNQIWRRIRERTPNNLALCGWGSYSQYDEDGIIRECLRRIALKTTLTKTAVEVGCGDGSQNNSHQLLLDGFSATWIDGAKSNIKSICEQLGGTVFPDLLVLEEMVNKVNAKNIALDAKNFLGSDTIDFLSLDIDGNDIHVCAEFVATLKPKLVCVEYNAKFPPPTTLAISYDESHVWGNNDFYGASLQAWVNFFESKNYTLVCCNLTGANAFFVHNAYLDVFTIYHVDEIYQPARYYLIDPPMRGHSPSLLWLKQRLKSSYYNGGTSLIKEGSIVIANAKYGQMAVYVNDMVIGKSLLENGSFQEHKILDVVRFLERHHCFSFDLFIDIGANIGTHSIFALREKLFKRAVAFEPDINNTKLLQKNFAINRISSMLELYCMALSDKLGDLQLELSNYNFGDHRIRINNPDSASVDDENKRLTREIISTSLDVMSSKFDLNWSNGLIWMDTQGHEGLIFEGGKNFLRSANSPKAIVCEFWPYGIERSASKSAYFDFLMSCNAIYDINSSDWQKGELISIDKLNNMYQVMLKSTTKEHHPHTDLLVIPNLITTNVL